MKAPGFWQRGGARLPRLLLTPASWCWRLAAWLRTRTSRAETVRVPVICVGNLTVGGAGKTPVVRHIAAQVAASGLRPGILARGYGGRLPGRDPVLVDPAKHSAADVGDEPLMHAARHPTVISPDRAAGARLLQDHADIIIMDDGFQNPGLRKNLSILVIDAVEGLGNGAVVPAGPLRETAAAGLTRANAVIALGPGIMDSRIARSGLPVLRGRLAPQDGEALKGVRVLGFCGIGRPEKFRETLVSLGADVAGFRAFADHHPYSDGEWAALDAEASRLDAQLVTTEKDAVRLSADQQASVRVVRVRLVLDQPALLEGLIADATRPVSAEAPPNRSE